MMMISYLTPETIKNINLDEEEQAVDDEEKPGNDEEEHESLKSATTVCLSPYCNNLISGKWFVQL